MSQSVQQAVEQRLAKRLPSSRPVTIISGKQSLYAIMTDFSKHGIGLIADVPLHVNQRIEIHFDIPANKTLQCFQFKAEVKHCIELHEQRHIGLKLDFPTQAYLSLYESLAAA